MSVILEAKRTTHTVFWLIKCLPKTVQVSNSDAAIYIHWTETVKEMGLWTVGVRLSLLEWEVKDKQGEAAIMSHISFSWYQSKTQMLNVSCSPRDSQECSPTPQFKALIHCHSAFLIVQFSHPNMTTGKKT